MSPVERVTSRDNPLLQGIRRLQAHPAAYRKLGFAWLEGEHLLLAAQARGWPLNALVVSDAWAVSSPDWWGAVPAPRQVSVPDALFAGLSSLDTPARIGAVIDLPASPPVSAQVFTVVLDRLQDAGNVGSILRSAAAFGVQQVLALKGTAALWSPKVLRAGMGAHFGLRLVEGLSVEALGDIGVPLLATSSHAGHLLGHAALPALPCGWVFGHEGQGIDEAVLARCQSTWRIPQPGGEESLNVAAAAAVCLYATSLGARPSTPTDPA